MWLEIPRYSLWRDNEVSAGSLVELPLGGELGERVVQDALTWGWDMWESYHQAFPDGFQARGTALAGETEDHRADSLWEWCPLGLSDWGYSAVFNVLCKKEMMKFKRFNIINKAVANEISDNVVIEQNLKRERL